MKFNSAMNLNKVINFHHSDEFLMQIYNDDFLPFLFFIAINNFHCIFLLWWWVFILIMKFLWKCWIFIPMMTFIKLKNSDNNYVFSIIRMNFVTMVKFHHNNNFSSQWWMFITLIKFPKNYSFSIIIMDVHQYHEFSYYF